MACEAAAVYSGCEAAGSCPCSDGPIGQAVEVNSIRDLVRSKLPSSIVQWPKVSGPQGMRQQLLWLRKFRGVSISGPHSYPACISRARTLSGPCEIPFSQLQQIAPINLLNRSLSGPVFWFSFAWSSQYAHWTIEHLPRLWYFLQLGRILQRFPTLLVPRSLSDWQRNLLEAIPTAHPVQLLRVTLLTLSPPHYFSTLYVPGLPVHMQLFWSTQSKLVWDRVRQIAAMPPVITFETEKAASRTTTTRPREVSSSAHPNHGANDGQDGGGGGDELLFSFRAAAEQGPGSGRVLVDSQSLGIELGRHGFRAVRFEKMTLQQKHAAFKRARVLVLECGSALANFMLMPQRLVVIVLCMQNHTSSRGCFSQMLTAHYTSAPIYTVRIGLPVNATEYATTRALGGKNNVQAHSHWTVNLSTALRIILSLSIDAVDVRRARTWHAAHHHLKGWLPPHTNPCGETSTVQHKQMQGKDQRAGALRGVRGRGLQVRSSGFDTTSGHARVGRRLSFAGDGAIYALSHCPGNSPWHLHCEEIISTREFSAATENVTTAAAHLHAKSMWEGKLMWSPCRQMTDYCESWRWCVRLSQPHDGINQFDSRENCWIPSHVDPA